MFFHKHFLPAAVMILLTGCMSSQPIYRPLTVKPESTPTPRPIPQTKPNPEKPTKTKTLHEVQDNNFDPEYMYPETTAKKYRQPGETNVSPKVQTQTASAMSKEECVAMLGEEKFERYTQMLGGESAAIKRCTLLKSMR